MNIKVVRNFFDGNVCEHRSIILDSDLDLGNYRALRTICDDDCGTKVMDSRDVNAWLCGAEVNTGAFQIQAAARYISAIRTQFAGELDLDPNENFNPEIEIICTITYA
jgi:hypothetical protein